MNSCALVLSDKIDTPSFPFSCSATRLVLDMLVPVSYVLYLPWTLPSPSLPRSRSRSLALSVLLSSLDRLVTL